jgi:signal transduction histidine kinase
MQEWQSLLAQLYDYFEEHDQKTSLIQDIDRTILRGDQTPLGFTIPFVERLLKRVDADGLLFFQREGPDSYALRHVTPPSDRLLPERLAAADAPELSEVLRRDGWPGSAAWIPDDANTLFCESVMFGEEPWGLLMFYWKRPVPTGQRFISDVVSQLSIGVARLISREQLVLFRSMHSLFFERDLDQKACLEVVKNQALHILKKHEEPILLQILFTEAVATDPTATDDEPLVIRWSSNADEVGVRVPLKSFSGRAMKDGKPYLLGDPTAPDFAESYKAFTTSSRTELAVVLRKDSGSQPLGVLNVESPRIDAFSSDEIERICSLVDLVSPMLAAVRRRVAMAHTEKALAAVAVNQTLDRLGRLYQHKFRTLQLGLDSSLDLARSFLTAGRNADTAAKLGSMAEDLADFKASHSDLWKRVKSVSRVGPVRVSEVVAEILKEERVTRDKYITVDTASLESMPPVRASGLLKEHLRNLLINSVRAIEKKAAGPPEYKGQIWISAERYAHSQSVGHQGHDDVAELNQRVRIAIRDNGVGLSPELEEVIFDVGYTTWGTGYGLAAARQYARELGGNVKAVGGEGCVITVELPVHIPGEDDEAEAEVDHY